MNGYKAGAFQVPASTGSFSVSGLGFTTGCQGVIFFGSNRSEEDTLVTDPNAGLFMGMMADTSSGVQAQVNSVIPRQGQMSYGTKPILMQSSFFTVEYQASPVSLDADGFTVNFTTVPGATRWIHYLAWGDFGQSDAFRVTQSAVTLTTGWAALVVFGIGCVSYGGGPGDWLRPDLPQYTFATWGGGGLDSDVDPFDPNLAMISTVRTTGYGQGNQMMAYDEPWVGWGAFYIGPFLGQAPQYAAASSPTTVYVDNYAGLVNSGLYSFWTGPATVGGITPAATAGGTIVEPLNNGVQLPEALLLFGVTGREDFGDTLNPDNGITFGVVTDDYQGCVVANMGGNYFYQSRTKAFASSATSGGVNAGTIVLNTDGTFTATTTVDSTAPEDMVYIAFGPGADTWIPHIYRWLKR